MDMNETTDISAKSKRPSDSAFKQQRLPAWQPILTAGTVLPTFFVIGIAFIPVGIGLLYFSDKVSEKMIDYTDCYSTTTPTMKCSEIIARNATDKCKCSLDFTLDGDFKEPVFMYYSLTNFYQNHRRYVKSRDDNQLLGRLSDPPSTDCFPFASLEVNGTKMPVAPCGAIANSLFSDNLEIFSKVQNSFVPLLRTGIAWSSDKQIKFRNPPGANLQAAFAKYTKPVNWTRHVWQLDTTDPNNNGFENEDLIVWMRTAALPNFRKLYRRVNHEATGYKLGLSMGNYTLHVDYSYQVTSFEGTKRMILSTTSMLGGKNPFLGIAYIVVGCFCLLLGIVFLFIHLKCGNSTTEMITVSSRTPYE